MRLLLCSILILGVSACGTGGRFPGSRVPAPPEHGHSAEAMHQYVARAKIALDSAARTENLRLLGELLNDATLVTDGESFRGGPEIVAALQRLAGGRAIERLQLVPERVLYCTDGVLERSGEVLIASVGETGPDTLSLPFSMRWRLTGNDMRMSRISVGAHAVRRTPAEPCPSLLVAESSRRRAVVWVLPPLGNLSVHNAGNDLQSTLESQGFSPKPIAFGSRAAVTPARKPADKLAGLSLGARIRLVDQLSGELSTSLRGPLNRVHAFNANRRLHVHTEHSATFVAAGLSYDWRRFRIGGGPIYMANNWEMLERELFHFEGGWQVQRVHTDSSWTTRRSALALEGGYWAPISRRMRVEFMGQYRAGGRETVPMTYIDPVSVSMSGYTVGLSLGVMY